MREQPMDKCGEIVIIPRDIIFPTQHLTPRIYSTPDTQHTEVFSLKILLQKRCRDHLALKRKLLS